MPKSAAFKRLSRACASVVALGLAIGALGCVRSRAVVTSDPPGANIHMNDINLGATPTEVPFTWYWYYDFKAEMDGYETAVVRKRFRAPIYLWPGFDLLMELMPFPVRDTKKVHLVLEPEKQRPAPEVVMN